MNPLEEMKAAPRRRTAPTSTLSQAAQPIRYAGSMRGSEDFDGPDTVARRPAEQRDGRPVRFEKVEPGDEQILPPREQRELDVVRSALDRDDQD